MDRTLLLTAAVLALPACEIVDYIELSPSAVILKQAGSQAWVQAKPMARTGVRAIKAEVSWSIRDPDIAQVSAKGLVTPVKSGETEVIARYGKIEARAPVSVIFVERIEVEPKTLTLVEGDATAAVQVKAYAKDGRLLTDRTATLNSNNKKVAQIAGGMGVMPLDPGEAVIDVQVEGQKASIQVKVEPDKKAKK